MTLQSWFEKGMTFEQYRSSMQVNQQEFGRVYEQVAFTEDDIATFNVVTGSRYRGIVLTADWCGDAALNVPIVQKMAEHCEMELRYLIRDENLELMDQYLTNGTSRAIPIFIFINEDGEEVSVWGPRSPAVQQMITEQRAHLPAADAPDFQEKQKQMYSAFKERVTTDPAIWRTVIENVIPKLTVRG